LIILNLFGGAEWLLGVKVVDFDEFLILTDSQNATILSHSAQWSSLPIQAQARGKSLPELQKACGLIGPLVIIEERRALGVKISRIVCGNDYIEYKLSD
jgi:hypothetical protein